jgi:hypothetical protein
VGRGVYEDHGGAAFFEFVNYLRQRLRPQGDYCRCIKVGLCSLIAPIGRRTLWVGVFAVFFP